MLQEQHAPGHHHFMIYAMARAAVRLQLGTGSSEDFIYQTNQISHWEQALDWCEHHGVLQIISQQIFSAAAAYDGEQAHIKNNAAITISDAVKQSLKERLRKNAEGQLWQVGNLVRISRAFSQANVRMLAIKGAALAQLYFGDWASRQASQDVDILVHPNDVAKAVQILAAFGYVPLESLPDPALGDGAMHRFVMRHYGQIMMRPAAGNVPIDLHWGLVMPYFYFNPSHQEVWASAQQVVLAGEIISTLGDHDALLFAAVHGCKEGWLHLRWLVDVAMMLKSVKNDVVKEVIEIARRRRCLRMLLVAAALVEQEFQISLPHSLSELITQDLRASVLAKAAAKDLQREPPVLRSHNFQFFARCMDTSSDSLREITSSLRPWPADWPALERLPLSLFFLRGFVRSVRLTCKYVRRALRMREKMVIV